MALRKPKTENPRFSPKKSPDRSKNLSGNFLSANKILSQSFFPLFLLKKEAGFGAEPQKNYPSPFSPMKPTVNSSFILSVLPLM